MSHLSPSVLAPERLFPGSSDLADLMRSFDWAATSLGPPERWPQSLRTTVGIVLCSPLPMIILWGDDLVQLYNDGYRDIMGAKHPAGLGQPNRLCWPEVWDFTAPIYAGVRERGETFHYSDQRLVLLRHGVPEDTSFTLTYSPVPDEQGAVGGILVTVQETTQRVRAEQHLADTAEQLRARNAEVDLRNRALNALAAFNEAVGTQSDVLAIARQAEEVLRANLPHVHMAYYELEGERWQARVWSESISADTVAQVQKGVPVDAPSYAEAVRTASAVFVDGWNAHAEQLPGAASYGAVALIPFLVEGRPYGIFTVGTHHARTWLEPEKMLIRALARALGLALERAEVARRLHAKNEELDARNRVLHAFEDWSRDLAEGNEPGILIARAQDLLYDLLPIEATVYYEREGERWFVRSMRGEFGNDGLRRAHEEGLPHDTTGNLRIPYETGEVFYQDVYYAAVDGLAEHMTHVTATAMLPLRTARGVRGIFGLGCFNRAGWTATDRTVIETVWRSLELALDRADKAAALVHERAVLAERTAALAAANEELEAFTYSVSHDLRTPVRHILGFNDLLHKTVGPSMDAKAQRYLTVVHEAAQGMNILIDAMLDMSRMSRVPLRLGPVDLEALLRQIQRESEPELLARKVEWEVGVLPLVTGDHDMLRQVLTNLVANALKYTRGRDVARIRIWTEAGEACTKVFVADNGVGFDPRYAGKLFGVFQRLHRQDEFEGTGVGLANVRRIIARHGGEVFAASEPGGGATFGFSLPNRVAGQ